MPLRERPSESSRLAAATGNPAEIVDQVKTKFKPALHMGYGGRSLNL